MAVWGQQFSSGDQGKGRYVFWESVFTTCPSCQGKDIGKGSQSAGCRMNGDGYGTDTFNCKGCGWSTSFQYDEAGDGTYYYETDGWKRKPKAPAPPKEAKQACRMS